MTEKGPETGNIPSGSPDRRAGGALPRFLVALALAIPVLAIYRQVGGHGFILVDDNLYVTENPVVLKGLTLEGIAWSFSNFHAANWHPLTWLSHMIDVEIFGPSPGWHHRMNLLHHLLNTELLFFVLFRMTGGMWQSAFAAALFGMHPLRVESVAWVAERKDLLCGLFWILATGAYLRYVRRPGKGRYLLVASLFAFGLMCKPMLVTLPFALLLLDYWPLGRFPAATASALAREKAPLLAMSGLFCVLAYLSQAGGGAVESFDVIPAGQRLANAFVSYAAYLRKTAWPSSLAMYYPHPGQIRATYPIWETAGAVLVVCLLTVAALREGRRRPCLAAGVLWYLGTLVPVIGLVQIGSHAHADRFTYIPLVGIFLAAAWGIPTMIPDIRLRRPILGALAGASLLAFSLVSWFQAGYWRDNVTLLSRTIEVTDDNWFAMNSLGYHYKETGDYRRAIGYIREALRIKPDFADAWNNLGMSYNGLGRYQEAIDHYREALRIRPRHADAWNNLGAACNGLGRYQEAIDYYREALRNDPGHFMAWNNLGISYYELGQYPLAVASFRESLRIFPGYAEARKNLLVASGKLGLRR